MFVLYSVRSVKIVHFLIRISGRIGRRKELKRFTIKDTLVEIPVVMDRVKSSRFESGLIHNNNQIINLMTKGIKTITGDWVNSISKLKLGEVVRIPDESYDCVMSSARYRLKRKYKVLIEREGEKEVIKGFKYFKIKRTA